MGFRNNYIKEIGVKTQCYGIHNDLVYTFGHGSIYFNIKNNNVEIKILNVNFVYN